MYENFKTSKGTAKEVKSKKYKGHPKILYIGIEKILFSQKVQLISYFYTSCP